MSLTDGHQPKADVLPFPGSDRHGKAAQLIAFQRSELNHILRVYGHMVALGEWRDYAIDHGREEAVFSIFRRASEVPLYRIVKRPKSARRQGAYAVIAASGAVLKRGHELDKVLKVFDRKRLAVVT